MGRKTRNKITAEDEYNRERKISENKELKEDQTKEERDEEEHKEQKEKMYFMDLFDILFDIFKEYAHADPRIGWINTSDILHGPGYNLKILYDESILELVAELFYEIQQFIKLSKTHTIDDDDDGHYMDMFSNLTENIIYSRIVRTINKWYIGQVY